MLTDEQRKALNESISRVDVKTREGGGGKTLSYVEAWAVIDLLNTIIGAGRWGYECEATEVVRAEGTSSKGSPQWRVTYTSRCVLRVEGCVPIADYGAGHGIDKDLGAAVESAIKEAASDSLKRCAKSLGRKLGLALYDKTQEHVRDEPVAPPPPATVPGLGMELAGIVNRAKDRVELEVAKSRIKARWPEIDATERKIVSDAVKAWKEHVE